MSIETQYPEISDVSTQLDDVNYAIFGIPYQPKFQEKSTSTLTLDRKVSETNIGSDETGILVRYPTGEERSVSSSVSTERLERGVVDLS